MTALLALLLAAPVAGAHSGGLDAHGCHAGSRPYHCHRHSYVPVQRTPPAVHRISPEAHEKHALHGHDEGCAYIVGAGDTLAVVAEHHKMTLDELISRNEITDPNAISVGQHLWVKTGCAVSGDATSPHAPSYKIKLGTPDADLEAGDMKQVSYGLHAGQLDWGACAAVARSTGRVEIEYYVNGERVTSAQVFANTTGDSELGNCVVKAVKAGKMPAGVQGEVIVPFLIERR